jgi:diaminopimelate decarboxylase
MPTTPSAFSHHPSVYDRFGFDADSGLLLVGGIPIDRLAVRAGGTPFFAYDRALISKRVEELKTHLPADLDLRYAIKANPFLPVVQHLAGLVEGLDVASVGELRLALDTTMSPADISFTGPGKSEDEIAAAVASGVLLTAESLDQVRQALEAGERMGLIPRLAVRLNPPFDLKASGMVMGGGAQPFGIDAEDASKVIRSLVDAGGVLEGLHVFSGSQLLDAKRLGEITSAVAELVIRLCDETGIAPAYINVGGGFGIPYAPDAQPLALDELAGQLAPGTSRIAGALPNSRVGIELGRYLVGEAGVYIARVLEVKKSRGKIYVITDGGLHHHLAASGNFGQVVKRNYPVRLANRMNRAPALEMDVVGRLCTPLDVLARRCALPEAQAGDLVAVFLSGAYAASASPKDFLGHPHPQELLV